MYQVIIETTIDGNREIDSVYTKIYTKKGFAERKAEELARDYTSILGYHVVNKAYVRKMIAPVTECEAKKAYCHSYPVYIDGEYGQVKLTPSYYYGSHASEEELFYRSVHAMAPQYNYNGNYYIEVE